MLPESVAEQQSLRYRRNESKAPVAWSLQTNWSRYPGATPNKFRTLDAAAYHNPAHSQAVGRISRVVLTCQALVERGVCTQFARERPSRCSGILTFRMDMFEEI